MSPQGMVGEGVGEAVGVLAAEVAAMSVVRMARWGFGCTMIMISEVRWWSALNVSLWSRFPTGSASDGQIFGGPVAYHPWGLRSSGLVGPCRRFRKNGIVRVQISPREIAWYDRYDPIFCRPLT